MDKYHQYTIELLVDTNLTTTTTQALIEKLAKQLGVELTVKAALLANPQAVNVSAQVYRNGSHEPFDLTPDEGTFALKRLPTT